MVTLQKKETKCNSNLIVTNQGGNLSSRGGAVLVRVVEQALGLDQKLKQTIALRDYRTRASLHQDWEVTEQLMYQKICGARTDSAANTLRHDPVFQEVLGKDQLASQSTISRYWTHFSPEGIAQLEQVNTQFVQELYTRERTKKVIVDVDTTLFQTYGNQEQANYNAHYHEKGYGPLLAFDAEKKLFLGGELRPGSQHGSRNTETILERLLDSMPKEVKSIMVRGDSAFGKDAFYCVCEKADRPSRYAVKQKAYATLDHLAETSLKKQLKKRTITDEDLQSTDYIPAIYHNVWYFPDSWSYPRRVAIKSVRPEGELHFIHQFVTTSFTLKEKSAKDVFRFYNKRGEMENYIKDQKIGFSIDRTSHPSFLVNEADMMITGLAYNLLQAVKLLCLEKRYHKSYSTTIREALILIAGKIVSHAGKTFLHLDSYHPMQNLFFTALTRAQAL